MGNFRKVFYGRIDNGMTDLANTIIKTWGVVEIIRSENWKAKDFDKNLPFLNYDCELMVFTFVHPDNSYKIFQQFMAERMIVDLKGKLKYEVDRPRLLVLVDGDLDEKTISVASFSRRFELVHFKFGGAK